jgi:hypothetical protein
VETPAGKFLPGTGQHTAILTIPSELEGLKPHELHRSVRVETKGSHRLVAKAKLPAWPGPKHRGSISDPGCPPPPINLGTKTV